MTLVISRGLAFSTYLRAAEFSSFTFSGPFVIPREGWSIGTAGGSPYGVGIKPTGVDEPIHDSSGSIM